MTAPAPPPHYYYKDGTESILQSIHAANSDNSSEHLLLNNKMADGHSSLAQDICASTAQLTNGLGQLKSDVCSVIHHSAGQHAHLQDRVSSIGEKNVVSTLQTGKEILTDLSDTSRHLGSLISDVNKDVLKAGCETTNTVITANRDVGLNMRDAIDRAETAITKTVVDSQLSTERLSAESRLASAVLSGELRSTNTQTVSDLRSAIHGVNSSVLESGRQTDLRICKVSGDLREKIGESIHNTTVARCMLERQAADNKSCLERQICETVHAVTDARCLLERQASDNRYSIERQAVENKASIELEACKNHSSLSKQISDCCCEVKEKIERRYCETAQLIREVDSGRIRDKLASMEQENLFLKLQSQMAGESRGRGSS